MVELANASVVNPGDLDSKLGMNKIISDFDCIRLKFKSAKH
jgi:hypothetical protein